MTAREIQYFNRNLLRWTILTWLGLVLMWGYTNIHQDLINEDLVHVKNLTLWSLLDFVLWELPWLALFLVAILGLELICLKNPWKMVISHKK